MRPHCWSRPAQAARLSLGGLCILAAPGRGRAPFTPMTRPLPGRLPRLARSLDACF